MLPYEMIDININPFDTAGLPILTGPETYENWSEALSTHLQLIGLWSTISNDTTTTPPSPPTRTTEYRTTPSSIRLQLRPNTLRLPPHQPTHEIPLPPTPPPPLTQTKKIILQTLTPRIRNEVMNLPSPGEIWSYLDAKYYIVHPLDGLQAAQNIFYEDCGNVQDYALKMKRALEKIDRCIGPKVGVPEAMKVQFLLAGLGREWRGWVGGFLERWDVREVGFEGVVEELRRGEGDIRRVGMKGQRL
ncbi:uncharacterized protein BO80DRAFT_470086 [Aspergillus ibericus CBS 121593]|uniref:DUF4219 domain-containing protein n=1 Tax=Aspergillus ibericus CBS 121593 TaxID=1448316 RepID=A0A395HET8_9EURO|nr:hypothetical protein BO80DRAFT_470086 [Aspergillus ibericus CBS 121593]RAL06166.1 hypothetical protein BO80DRAFT_470086 [Aspergillus ibericus CBS 121593]